MCGRKGSIYLVIKPFIQNRRPPAILITTHLATSTAKMQTCLETNMEPPLISFYREDGAHILTYEEDLKAAEEERRISAGGHVDLSDIDGSKWGFLY